MMPGLLPDNISKPHNHTWLNSLILIFMLTNVYGKFLMHQMENPKTIITFRTDDVENALPVYKREWALTRPLQSHINGTQYSCNFFILWPIKYNHTIFKITQTPKNISDTRTQKLWEPISENLSPPKIPLLRPISDSCSGPLFLLMLHNPYVYTDFLIVYFGGFDRGEMPPLKKASHIHLEPRMDHLHAHAPFSCDTPNL